MAASRWGFLVILLAAVRPLPAQEADLSALIDGVKRLPQAGVPGPVCVFGPRAFPVVAGGSNGAAEALVAAARFESGRIVVLGHGGYLERDALETANTKRLLINAAKWLLAGRAEGKVLVRGSAEVRDALRDAGLDATDPGNGWLGALAGSAVLVGPAGDFSAEEIGAVRSFVSGGGGWLTAGLMWGWLQTHPGLAAEHHTGNRILAEAGLVLADGYLEAAAGGIYEVAAPPVLVHAGRALDAILGAATKEVPRAADDITRAVHAVTRAVRAVPAGDRLFRPGLARLRSLRKEPVVPTAESPVRALDPLARVLLTLDIEEAASAKSPDVKAHPASAAFPGPVPAGAARVARAVVVDPGVPRWHSTGLYAPPGGRIMVRRAAASPAAGLSVRIGAHTDGLWHHDAWKRAPEISRAWDLKGAETEVASAFGGLVYFEARRRDEPAAELMITGAVEAPHFVRGSTSIEAWRSRIRLLPAPWGELESDKVIITVPAAALRALEDPGATLAFWDGMMDCCADLSAAPRRRTSPERYVADVQIGGGYMHSGYPVMTHLDVVPLLADPRPILKDPGAGWGFFHEMGHNHQRSEWTFDGAGEVTCNLFSIYCIEDLCQGKETVHESMDPARIAARTRAHLAEGSPFERWKADPFLALTMYVQLRRAFGWEVYKKVFAGYRELPELERPRTDDEKRDQWLMRFSHAAGRDLGPFFERWGVPVSSAAREKVAGLPPWLPPEMEGK